MVMPNALDLYSKVEDMLGVNEVTPTLYRNYFETLQNIKFDSLLDVGCGRGASLAQLQRKFPSLKLLGIDLSPLMVESTIKRGVEAKNISICEVEGKFDVITAVFDMVNYLNQDELRPFMRCIEERLQSGGYFICDINSLYAFQDLAVGSFIRDGGGRFVTVDSEFEDNIYYSEFTLFQKEGECFIKSQDSIVQYYHTVAELESSTNLELIEKRGISVYGDEVEKFYLIFQS
jgi:SAM-dependent methyltransferase